MSTVTPNLGLFKYDTTNPTDLAAAFNINTALNANWDIIDNAITHVDGLPDQTDKADYLLTTNGTEASWGETGEIFPVIETYQDGYSWYRIWSDGLLEQGGTWGQNNGAYAQYTVEFMKNFANMNYTLFVQGNWSDPSATSCRIDERTLSGFKGTMANNLYSTMPSYWYACGILGM